MTQLESDVIKKQADEIGHLLGTQGDAGFPYSLGFRVVSSLLSVIIRVLCDIAVIIDKPVRSK